MNDCIIWWLVVSFDDWLHILMTGCPTWWLVAPFDDWLYILVIGCILIVHWNGHCQHFAMSISITILLSVISAYKQKSLVFSSFPDPLNWLNLNHESRINTGNQLYILPDWYHCITYLIHVSDNLIHCILHWQSCVNFMPFFYLIGVIDESMKPHSY